MKNIEQLIKESLENHELPFNEAAWESMSKRLDGTTPTPFYRKWWVAASIGTVLVGSALFFGLRAQSEASKSTHESAPAVSQNSPAASSGVSSENRFKAEQRPSENNASQTAEKQVVNTVYTAPNELTHTINQEPVQSYKVEQNPKTTSTQTGSSPVKNAPDEHTNTQKEIYLPIVLAQTSLCIGDDIEITNPNETLPVSVIHNNRTQLIKGGAKRTFTATAEGVIEIVSGKNTQTITVNKPSDKLYISADPTLLYENGVPSVEFSISGAENAVQWSVEKYHSEVQNGNLIVHPYTGKEIAVKATSKDANGCTVTEKKTITIKEEYNLQAVNAININSADPRNNRFMPYALIERNAAFEMTIIDAKSGRVVFKTNDVSNAWDGTDMNTGSLAQTNITYVWKVTLKNPLPGEPKVYNGTILLNN
jgi:hypothetical protein